MCLWPASSGERQRLWLAIDGEERGLREGSRLQILMPMNSYVIVLVV